ncbi:MULTISPECIES: branched-chain amino acid ABC transporter permease [Aminobacter]|uniref:Branched-chain amino acid transport system permease protein n=1 Tax=Aminobacter ciceronei TaxID=150723 RepID=A0ABR6CB31_9HYPH|nr:MULTISPECIES: branched-chain amino acid ABC transporter permease [Aminobacter]MBA8908319.1 branched-chain amino acid transport system permease protein [Aminobacter ciceronei]MBA9022091.1 branched-chain amino acid transport system permease protein [Aminobacter ciceronei]MRX34633.1 branched-chain amino acid ABC transporter permease [Aminobacter sp. MDW-2]QNH34775.1 branched-chain amino acid ABC transporter permease [Aminobacter sp. MDW-2]
MTSLVQAIIDGLMVGGVYAVISIGLTLVFGVLGIVNFAQAEFLMLGMYIAYFAWAALGLDPLAGAFLAFGIVFALGYGLQRTIIQRVLKAPAVSQVFLTVGLLIVMENGALLAFGSQIRSVTTAYQTKSLQIGPFFVSLPYLAAFLMSIASGVSLWWVLNRSWLGMAIRATAIDPMAGRLIGINIDRVMAIAFGLGVGLTAFGGAVVLPYLSVFPTAGSQFVVLMFTVAVLGGLGSVAGAVVGGLAVGVITSVSALMFPIQLQNLVLFLVFIAILALRPDGLMGRA